VLSRLQLDAGQLARLGQGRDAQASPSDGANPPDVVFYTGCNVLKTPHIALLCLDILDVLGVSYRVLGGPSHCCGIVQYRLGDLDAASRLGGSAIDKFARTGASEVLAWCPSCFVQFSEINTPNYERAREEEPLPMRPFLLFLLSRIEDLRPHLAERVRMRVALHAHPGVDGVPDAARALLQAVPGVELVDLQQPEIGLMSNSMRALPDYQRQLQQAELEAAAAAGIDALVAVYHADHRELCAHERDWPFAIVNVLEIIAASMGILRDDDYKRLKLKQDASAILEDCAHMLSQHGIDRETARQVIETAMLADQPLPLRSGD
jgi:heterodisulfide reductase subunit D